MTLALLAMHVTLYAAAQSASQPVAKTTTRPTSAPAIDWAKHYYDRVDLFKRENATLGQPQAGTLRIVLVGSSHIERFKTARFMPERTIVNRGIASDRIGIDERGVLHRLDSSVFDCHPGFIFLENGVNDLGELWRNGKPSLDEIDACYREVVKRIRTRLPDVPLVIVGLFPARDRYAGLKPLILDFNKRLAKIAADNHCPFMDAYAPFADDDGLLRKELSADGLHLSDAGYKIWAGLIEKALPAAQGVPASQPTPRSR